MEASREEDSGRRPEPQDPDPSPSAFPEMQLSEGGDAPPPDRKDAGDALPHLGSGASLGQLLAEDSSLPLEQRIRRIEDALAQMQESRRLQERIQDRPGAPSPAPPAPAAPPAAPEVPRPRPLALPAGLGSMGGLDALADLRAMWRMFVDPRYKLSMLGRFLPVLLLAMYLTSYLWVPGTSLPGGIGYLINKAADLVVGFFLFRVLIREARRYRQTAPELPASMRLK